MRTNRAEWLIHHGSIPNGMHVLHRCDNRACHEIEHLFLGTHADNMRDMADKGRASDNRGEGNPNVRLSDGDIAIIRSSPLTGRQLAAQYRVTKGWISAIRKGHVRVAT
jgi:hypothetical protein